MSQLRITSDGTLAGSTVYLDDEPLDCVRAVTISLDPDADGFCCATLLVDNVALDFHANVTQEPA